MVTEWWVLEIAAINEYEIVLVSSRNDTRY